MEQEYVPGSDENVFSGVWSKYFPYWPLFLLTLVLAIGAAAIYLKFRVPLYQSAATILIKDEKRGTEDSKVMESLNSLSGKKIIENEIEVIKSRALMKQVVQDLGLYAPVSEAGKWKDVSAYSSSPVKIEMKDPAAINEEKKVGFNYNSDKKEVTINGKNYPVNQWVPTPWGNLRFTETNAKFSNVNGLYFSLIHPKRIVADLLARINVTPVNKLSNVVALNIKDEVPQRSEDILNAVISAYDKASLNDKSQLNANTLAFIDERLNAVSADLGVIEKRLQQYRSNKGAIDISSQGQLFLKNVSENDQKLSDVNMKLAVLSQVEEYVTSKKNNTGVVPSTLGIEDPLLTDLLSKLYSAELEYERLRKTTAENNPIVSSVTAEIQKIKPSILESIKNQKLGLEASKNNISSTNRGYASQIGALPRQERELVEINREQNIKSSIYSFLLQKREETALLNSSVITDSRIIDKAESSIDPVGFSNAIVYIIAAGLAFALVISFVSFRESLNSKVLFRHEIETLTSFPVIGEIAIEKSKTPVVLNENASSYVAGQFRMLRTSLAYLGLGPLHKKILITSAISGDGKSFVSTNLAISLALTGKKVVLVEFDLVNPTLREKLNHDGGKGLAEYLLGNATKEEICAKTKHHPNLFLVPATGSALPANPSELILNDRTNKLIRTLEDNYDYVILDSAPVNHLSDGYVLSKLCDATLYVVRHNHTPKKILRRLDQTNQINELKNVGIVFNGIRTRGFVKNGYQNGYGYGYGVLNNKTPVSKGVLQKVVYNN